MMVELRLRGPISNRESLTLTFEQKLPAFHL